MTDNVTTAVFEQWVRTFAQLIAENREHLTELDAAIGDADHGSNMDRGMKAAVAALDDSPPPNAGALLSKVGMTLVSTVGGASGPLFGTMFMRMGASLGAAGNTVSGNTVSGNTVSGNTVSGNTVSGDTVSGDAFATALRAGLGGVVDRGKAAPGDKTMYDALAPAVDALERSLADDGSLATGLAQARYAAAAGRDATTPMLARKGRASYLGERSVGHQDPGAASVALLFEAAAAAAGAPPVDDAAADAAS